MSRNGYLNPDDHEILAYALAHLEESPRDVARHFSVPLERVISLIQQDLRKVTGE